MQCSRGWVPSVFLITLSLLALGVEAARAEEPPAAAASPAADAFTTKITVHGYLSQAYARTDGNEINGIPGSGTADYRAAAVQMRAEISPQDTFAVQLSHARLGKTGLQAFEKDVALDWMFYQHRFSDGTTAKVGKVQIPFGIYNEVRDVGTLLPFFRPSVNFYGEGSFTSETVDGAVLSHTFSLGGDWLLDGDVHYGNWSFVSRIGNTFRQDEVRGSRGVELWLQTPVPGLRIGAGGIRYDVLEGGDPAHSVPWKTYHVSLEGELGRLTAHAEYKYIDFDSGDYNGGYVHVGLAVTKAVVINAQYDYAKLNIDYFRRGDFDNDRALGVNYLFRPDLVLKVEHHWNKGFTAEVPAQNFFAPEPKTRYWIASLSTSF